MVDFEGKKSIIKPTLFDVLPETLYPRIYFKVMFRASVGRISGQPFHLDSAVPLSFHPCRLHLFLGVTHATVENLGFSMQERMLAVTSLLTSSLCMIDQCHEICDFQIPEGMQLMKHNLSKSVPKQQVHHSHC